MNDSSIRLVRRRFKCLKCHEYESKLVRPNFTRNPCSNCQGLLTEVNDKEYQLHKTKVNIGDIKSNKTFPIKPTKEHYKEHYDNNSKQDNLNRQSTHGIMPNYNYDNYCPPSNYNHEQLNNNNDSYFRSSVNNISNENEIKNDYQSRKRYQSNDYRSRKNNKRYANSNYHNYDNKKNSYNRTSTNGYNYIEDNNKDITPSQRPHETRRITNANMSNIQTNESNGFNLNTICRNIFNQDNIGGREMNPNPNVNENGVLSRTRSVEPTIRLLNPHGVFVIRSTPNYMPIPFGNTFFQNFFGEQAMTPFFQPQMFSMPFNIRVHRHNFDEEDIFDPQFTSFGSTLNGFFLDNFASNFRSNLENEVFERLINVIQDNLLQAESRKTKKTKKDALNSLKKFDMTDKYCKKNKNGKVEFPNCCICLTDIAKGEKTVLLPCGHMFHWKCCHSWLKDNNTCPVCRFELPAESGNERDRDRNR